MASANLADLTAGARETVGRYFNLVSMVPSMLLVAYVFLLLHSNAWNGHPDWQAAAKELTQIGIGDTLIVIFISFAFGLILHPIQFSLVQFFEGYWGTSVFAWGARMTRISYHQRKFDALRIRDGEGDDEAARLVASYYPKEYEQVMPTRLGNVLRRHETLGGKQYGLDTLTILTHIALVAPPEDVRYLDDRRSQLDLAVRTSFTALLACVISVIFLWQDGLWLLIALVPYGIAYLAYRGAVVTAREYGIAMETLVDLNRFALYERLHLPMPNNIEEERRINESLRQILTAHSQLIPMDYEHPQPPEGFVYQPPSGPTQ